MKQKALRIGSMYPLRRAFPVHVGGNSRETEWYPEKERRNQIVYKNTEKTYTHSFLVRNDTSGTTGADT